MPELSHALIGPDVISEHLVTSVNDRRQRRTTAFSYS